MAYMRTWTSGKANGFVYCNDCGAGGIDNVALWVNDREESGWEIPDDAHCPECDADCDQLELEGLVRHERECFGDM